MCQDVATGRTDPNLCVVARTYLELELVLAVLCPDQEPLEDGAQTREEHPHWHPHRAHLTVVRMMMMGDAAGFGVWMF